VRTVAVVTVGRSDYGLYLPILKRILADSELRLRLMVSGAHLSPDFGFTVRLIEADGFTVDDRIEMLVSSDSPEGIAKSIGLGLIGFSQAFARVQPDLLVVLGDRFEMYAAALAALPFRIPVAHIHGGEVTVGAFDDALRHSMTKLSHLHFVSTAESGRRVEQLGEEPWRIVVSGAPGLDNVGCVSLLSTSELEAQFGFPTQPPLLLVTFHPVTLECDQVEKQTQELLSALDQIGRPVVFTQPNADTGGRRVSEMITEFVSVRPFAHRIDNLGARGYFSLMNVAAAMVGNSSSGIIEAPSFGLPVVNIGTRQDGRVRAANVIDVEPDSAAIVEAIRQAVLPEFRERLRGMANPYGDGHASAVIVERLKSVALDHRLTTKLFRDLNVAVAEVR
jgi:UDP-hydrolysing UDP-N-acetyl-D-glucosamine 2-epimerase